MKRIPLIIDTDPGIDDAAALAIAVASRQLDIRLITTVAGNVNINQVTTNAGRLLSFFGSDIPLAQGASGPLLGKTADAAAIHGSSGLGNVLLPDPALNRLLSMGAVEAIADILRQTDEKITLLPIGPLTNIALLLKSYPELKKKIARIILMGGSCARGNLSIYGEFNIEADPEAARIVFTAGCPLTMVGLDVGEIALLQAEDCQKMRKMNKTGAMLYELFDFYRGGKGSMETGLKMYDSFALAYLLDPEMFETVDCFVGIETKGEYTRGATAVDLDHQMNQAANATVTVSVDALRFRTWFLKGIAACQV